MRDVSLPRWVVEDVLRPSKPIARWLVIMLFTHGSPVTDRGGDRRIYWRGSTRSLAVLLGCSQRALLEAERELQEAGWLILHNRTSPHAPHALSMSMDQPSAYKLSAASESGTAPHDDDDLYRSPDQDQETITITPDDEIALTICKRLGEWGVHAPPNWLRRWGAEDCGIVLDLLAAMDGASLAKIGNPAGLMAAWLKGPRPLPSPMPAYDSFEARKRRYLG